MAIGGLACEPYLRIEEGASDAELGTALLGVLAEARITPIPTDHKAEQKKIFQAAGVRSWTKLSEGVFCSVTQEPSGLSISPSRRESQAFMHMPEFKVRVHSGSEPDEVGRALKAAFQKCE